MSYLLKTLIYQGKNQLKISEKKAPKLINENEAIVKVKYTGICGSDITIWRGKHPRAKPGVVLGHEFVGEIEQISTNNKKFQPGDQVVVEPLFHCGHCKFCQNSRYNLCNNLGLYGRDLDGGFAEKVKVRSDKLFKTKKNLKQMAITEPLAVAINAVANSDFEITSNVLIFGAGTIGLLIAKVAKISGANNIVIGEIDNERITIAEELGFSTIDLTEKVNYLSNNKFDLIFDAAGHPNVIEQGLKLLKNGGQFNLVAIHKEKVNIDLKKITYSEFNFQGRFIYTNQDFRKAKNLLEKNRIKAQNYISKIYSLEEAIEGFKDSEQGGRNLKILLEI